MNTKVKYVVRILGFGFAAFAVFVLLTVLLTPYQFGTHTKETIRGMYDQPRNSVQVAFFGASNMLSAASPMAIYEQTGINSYNCSSSVQPMLMSYYLLKDLVKTQGESLQVVVIDPSIVLRSSANVSKSSWAERVLVNMPFSLNKIEATLAFYNTYHAKLIEELFPLMRYHMRWDELSEEDFDLTNSVAVSNYSHGEFVRYAANVEEEKTANRSSKVNGLITESIDYPAEELEALWQSTNTEYLSKIVDLCREKGIEVFFVKTPKTSWDDISHDSVKHMAEGWGIDFVDMCMTDFMQEYGLAYPIDFVDEKHPNIHGSAKISRFFSDYLTSHYDIATELSSQAQIAVAADADQYRKCVADGELMLCDNLAEYLERLDVERYTVFVSVQGGCTSGFSDAVVEAAGRLGLKSLGKMRKDSSYAAVLSEGALVSESFSDKEDSAIVGQYSDGRIVSAPMDKKSGASIEHMFKVKSPLASSGDEASIELQGKEVCEAGDGIKFVVYDDEFGELVDTSSFKLSGDYARTSDWAAPYCAKDAG